MKATMIASLCLTILSMITVLTYSTSVQASSSIIVWGEVARFTGSGTGQSTTPYFNCSNVEWRIRWSYIPDSAYPGYALFNVITYPTEGSGKLVSYVMRIGESITSGASYVHNHSGTFYCRISVEKTESYTIIVEQDLDSIPEFPSLAMMLVLLTATLVAALLCKSRFLSPSARVRTNGEGCRTRSKIDTSSKISENARLDP